MAALSDSILSSIRTMVFTDNSEKAFDPNIITHINSAIADLHQFGVGPPGFIIEDESPTWESYIGDQTDRFGWIVQFIYLKTKLVFDPPSNSFMVDIMKESLKETEWRLSISE